MIEEATTLEGGTILRTTLCIVGGGPAGIALALQFAGTGVDVLLLEGGGLEYDAASQALYKGEVADAALHSPADQYRHRQLGGSSATWGGRCIPFDPIDFEHRPWIGGSGWPIGHADVAPYYPAAAALAEAGSAVFTAEQSPAGTVRPMIRGFAPRNFDLDALERFSCPTNFGRRYGGRLAAESNVRVLLGANCTEIVTDASGMRVERLELRTLSGKSFAVMPERVVLATGGIEVPRLLLASSRHDPRGIGNAHDLVGRTYMCHIAGTLGKLHLQVPAGDVWHGYERDSEGIYLRRRMQLRPEAQRRLETGNMVFRLHHPRLPNPAHGRGLLSAIYLAKPLISYEYAKRLHGEETLGGGDLLRHVGNVLKEPLAPPVFAWNWLWQRTLAARKFPSLIVVPRNNIFSLDIHAEQVPNAQSRITLAQNRDPFGMPQARIDWRATAFDTDQVTRGLDALVEDLAASGKGRLSFDRENVASDLLRDGAYGGHHIGTARMGASPETGVVDRDCRVFGVSNLFIAGSAVFPTSSQANPTLTILAMALRLAAQLKSEIHQRGTA